jgi:photosystem II stability/assembly factor-like uncharacterized protein
VSFRKCSARKSVAILSAVVVGVVGLAAAPAGAHCPHDNILDVAISSAFSTDSTVLAISRGHLLRSTDLGASWGEVTNGIDRRGSSRLATAPSDKDRVYLIAAGVGVYRSDNQGRTWARIARPGGSVSIADIVVSPATADTVFATPTNGGLYRSVDGGQAWTSVGAFGRVTALAAPDTSGHVVVGDSTGAVFVSADNGTGWVKASGFPSGDAITALASPPGSGATVFAGTVSGAVYRSTNTGASFARVGSGVPNGTITSIAVSPGYATDHRVWLASWDIGVFRSADSGETFVPKSKNLSGDPQGEGVPDFGRLVVGVTGSGKTTIFLAAFHGLYRLDSGADSWREMQTLTEYVTGIAVSPNYGVDQSIVVGTYVKGVFTSRDRGNTFAYADVGLGGQTGQDFALIHRMQSVAYSPDYARDGTIFASTTSRMFRSTDRGASWIESILGANLAQPRFVVAPSPAYATDHTVYLGASNGDVWRSTARGVSNSWSLVSNVGSKIRSIVFSEAFAADRVMYESDTRGVRKSVDRGAHWTQTGPTTISLLAISPSYSVDGTLFAGTERGLWVTRDSGVTWTELNAAPLSTDSLIEAVAVSPNFAVDGTILLSVRGAGLFRSTNRGASFAGVGSLITQNVQLADFNSPTSTPLVFSPTYGVDRTIFGFGDKNVVRSIDGGTTWSVLQLPAAATLLQPPVVASWPTPKSVTEGAPGSQRMLQFAFDLSHPYTSPVTVAWNTRDVPGDPAVASSTAGDYVAASGTLVYAPGTTRQYVNITVRGDNGDETNETVIVATHNATNAKIGGFYGLGFGTIVDDDG